MTSIEPAILAKVKHFLAPEREEEWITLRNSMQDRALLDAPDDVFVTNMRAAYLQLFGGALMKALGGLDVLMRNPLLVMQMHKAIKDPLAGRKDADQIEALMGEYNHAYGSSPSNGIGAMSGVFSRLVAKGMMSSNAKNTLTEHFTLVSMSMISELSREKSGPRRFNQEKRETTGPKQGCFIATACYGDSEAPQVIILRNFRDTHLLPSRIGSYIMDLYNATSPNLATVLSKHPRMAGYVRERVLDPIVKLIQRTDNE